MSAKILVVDDEPDLEALVTQRFRREIRCGELSFRFAHNGEEALTLIGSEADFDVVLSDINMPVMDGLTLLSRLSALGGQLKAVIVSAYGDMANIRTAMNRGAFDFLTKPIDFADLQLTLQKTIGEVGVMREALRRRDAAERARLNLSRYFAPNMVDMLSTADQPLAVAQELPAAVLFADIVGFTALCTAEPPVRIFELLREFCRRMANEVFESGGTLDKYIGDGLMATFGTPISGAGDATRALACATGMARVIAIWNEERVAAGERPFEIAIGIHHGPVLLGDIGDERRLEFATIGDTVNVASRLEGLARALQAVIVVSEAFVQAVSAEGGDVAELFKSFHIHESQSIRGRAAPMRMWALPRAKAAADEAAAD